jgi:hypothetical protein
MDWVLPVYGLYSCCPSLLLTAHCAAHCVYMVPYMTATSINWQKLNCKVALLFSERMNIPQACVCLFGIEQSLKSQLSLCFLRWNTYFALFHFIYNNLRELLYYYTIKKEEDPANCALIYSATKKPQGTRPCTHTPTNRWALTFAAVSFSFFLIFQQILISHQSASEHTCAHRECCHDGCKEKRLQQFRINSQIALYYLV